MSVTTNWVRIRYRQAVTDHLPHEFRLRVADLNKMTQAERDALQVEKDLYLMFPDVRDMSDAEILNNARNHHLPASSMIIRRGQSAVHRNVWPPREEIEAYQQEMLVKYQKLAQSLTKTERVVTILGNNLAEYDEVKAIVEEEANDHRDHR